MKNENISNQIPRKRFYANGSLEWEGYFENENLTGYWKKYFINGYLSSVGHYKNNLPVGYWKFFFFNGTTKCETIFII